MSVARMGHAAAPVNGQLYVVGGNSPGFLSSLEVYTTAPKMPASQDDCKAVGWTNFTRANGSAFRNQGECIQYVNTGR